jgi:hypothetical protein
MTPITIIERARGFDSIVDGHGLRDELGVKPKYPRLADAIAAGGLAGCCTIAPLGEARRVLPTGFGRLLERPAP